jgi:hypothetical protein
LKLTISQQKLTISQQKLTIKALSVLMLLFVLSTILAFLAHALQFHLMIVLLIISLLIRTELVFWSERLKKDKQRARGLKITVNLLRALVGVLLILTFFRRPIFGHALSGTDKVLVLSALLAVLIVRIGIGLQRWSKSRLK